MFFLAPLEVTGSDADIYTFAIQCVSVHRFVCPQPARFIMYVCGSLHRTVSAVHLFFCVCGMALGSAAAATTPCRVLSP